MGEMPGLIQEYECERCGIAIESDSLPSECPACERSAVADADGLHDTRFHVKLEFMTDGMYRHYRTQGLTEPQALAALERDDKLYAVAAESVPWKAETAEGRNRIATLFRRFSRSVLKKAGLLDEHPVGWNPEENAAIGMAMDFEDVVWRVSQIVDAPRGKIVNGTLLSAQGHLASVLPAIGPAIHAVFLGPKWGSGKSHAAEAFTILGDGKWLAAA